MCFLGGQKGVPPNFVTPQLTPLIRSDVQQVDFTMPGDSGALVVARGDEVDRQPVGLVFASARKYTVANPINEVLTALDVDIEGDL